MNFLGNSTDKRSRLNVPTSYFGSKNRIDDPRIEFLLRCQKDINFYLKLINFSPTWQQRQYIDALVAGEPNIAVRSGKGPGKCIPADMEVLTESGYIKAVELEGKEFKALSLEESDLQLRWNKAVCAKDIVKEVVKITTSSGNELEISTDHPVYTQRGWVEAGKLTTEDMMTAPRGYSYEPKIDIDPLEAEFIGYISGDGATTGGSVKFTQQINSTLARMILISDALGFKTVYRERYDYGVSKAIPLCKKYGIHNKKSIDKRIPRQIWQSGDKGLIPYFKAFMECDGYVTKDGIGVCLGSKGLIKDLQAVLARWDIPCSIRYKKSKCNDKWFDAWRLEVNGSYNLQLLYDKVGDIRNKIVPSKLRKKKSNPNNDPVPITKERWDYILGELGIHNSVPRKKGYRGYSNSLVGRGKFESFVEEFSYTGKYSKYAGSQVQWVRIESIEHLGKKQTYAVSVDRDHNFVCENLIIHNTAVSSAVIPWWVLVNPMSQGITTAPTMAQCKSVWLSQALKWIADGDPRVKHFFTFTNTGFGILGHKQDVWGLYLRTATKPEAFQGIHNERLIINCEEASGISRPIMQAIQDTLTGQRATLTEEQKKQIEEDKKRREVPAQYKRLHKAKNVWVAIGNANTRTCRFFDFFHSLAGNPWTCFQWNAEETPISSWFSGERNKEIEEEFGRDSDVYRVAVMGEFPSTDPDSLLSELDLDVCFTEKALQGAMAANDTSKAIGIDLARFGGDSNVVVFRHGGVMLEKTSMTRVDPNQAVEYAVMKQDHYGWKNADAMYVVDTSGMGEGVVGNLGSKRKMGKRVHEFYSQNTAHESEKYANKITEAWCLFAKRVRKGEIYLGEKKDRKLILQLTNRKYGIDNSGRIKIESKDEYKKRNADIEGGELGKSPDDADATVMAFYPHAHESQRICVG